jgi:SAM-dependent methyltransferase
MQPKMLTALRRRAQRAGLLDRIEMRKCAEDGLGIEDLAASIDFAVAIHMVHEVPSQEAFFSELSAALMPGGKLLLVEPKHHVSQGEFAATLAVAKAAGFEEEPLPIKIRGRCALLVKGSP